MKTEVFKTWALVLHLGISILVPILLLVAVGYFVREKFNFDIMLILILLGLAVGVRNVYVILKSHINSIKRSDANESELLKKHERAFRDQKKYM